MKSKRKKAGNAATFPAEILTINLTFLKNNCN
jgi:hypothetical protein